jgi:hypothetical protein
MSHIKFILRKVRHGYEEINASSCVFIYEAVVTLSHISELDAVILGGFKYVLQYSIHLCTYSFSYSPGSIALYLLQCNSYMKITPIYDK